MGFSITNLVDIPITILQAHATLWHLRYGRWDIRHFVIEYQVHQTLNKAHCMWAQ